MFVNWKSTKEESPLAVQVISMKTGYKYDPAYHSLINDNKEVITYPVLEGFFDNQGWFPVVYNIEFPGWRGQITDSQNNVVWNDPNVFFGVHSRNHAKSLLAGIIIKAFEEQLKGLMKVPEGATKLGQEHLEPTSRGKFMEHIQVSDLNSDGHGLLQFSTFCYLEMDKQRLVLKNEKELPFVGMILPV